MAQVKLPLSWLLGLGFLFPAPTQLFKVISRETHTDIDNTMMDKRQKHPLAIFCWHSSIFKEDAVKSNYGRPCSCFQ